MIVGQQDGWIRRRDGQDIIPKGVKDSLSCLFKGHWDYLPMVRNIMCNTIRMGRPNNKFLTRLPPHQAALLAVVTLQVVLFELAFSFWDTDSLLVYGLVGWRYLLMGFVGYDVWRVTSCPPTDPLLTGTLCSEGIEPEGLHFCILCQGLVFNSSHHCFRCGECAYDFDHHCKYLNVCVGGSNYLPFLGLLGSFILYCIAAIVLALLQESCWERLVELGMTGGLLALAVVLFGFHFYLNRIGKTTFEYMIPVEEEGDGSRPVPVPPPVAF